MSAIINVMGRFTKDPTMQKAKNSETEYISVDMATTQRGTDGENETIYYECYFNNFLAQRLIKASVKKGMGLMVYGDLELHPFVYQKGQSAGKAGSGARINVKDWHFVPSNRQDGNTGANNAPAPAGYNQSNPGGAAPAAGNYQGQGYPNPGGNYANGYGTQNAGYNNAPPMQPNAPAGNMPQGAMQGGYQNMPNYNGMPAGNGYGNDGFSNIPENQANQLPFS